MTGPELRIGDRLVGDGHPVLVIAEGCDNHLGDMGRAREMIHAAAAAGADAIKFQHHLPDEEMLREGVPTTANFDEPLYEFLQRCALTLDQHAELVEECASAGITYLCTPFSAKAAEEIAPLGVPAFKIGSGELTDLPSLARIAEHGVPLICSTGMATHEEIDATVAFLRPRVAGLALLNCTSAYPTRPEDVDLGVIGVLRERHGLVIGHSDHTPEIWTTIGSVVAGARIVEKHLTLDHALPGPDRDVSIDPSELADLVRGVRQVEVALGAEKRIRPEEAAIREWAHRSVVTVRPVAAGSVLGPDDLATKRPGTGIPAARLGEVQGRRAARDLPADHLVAWPDLDGGDA